MSFQGKVRWVVSKAAELKKDGFETLPLALAARSDFGVSGGGRGPDAWLYPTPILPSAEPHSLSSGGFCFRCCLPYRP